MADFGDVLMEFEEKSSKTKQLEVLKNDVKLLKRKRTALLQREVQFRSDINAGSMKSPDGYKLPLSVVQPVVQGQVLTSDSDVTRLKTIALAKQKLQVHAFCNGVTSFRDDEETKFIFDPYVGGVPHGPYVLRIKFLRQNAIMRGHTIPHAVPIRSLYSEYFEDSENHAEQLAPFIKSIAAHLRAFLSRKQQCERVRKRFAVDILEFQSTNHYTAISFTIGLKDEESPEGLRVTISMIYDKDGERPKYRSLKVQSSSLTEEDRLDLEQQCEVFYEENLVDAFKAAF